MVPKSRGKVPVPVIFPRSVSTLREPGHSLPNLDRMSCCSSLLEKRILGFRPLRLVFSQGGASRLGLSLGSTSTSRFTWNRSGYFSWMSQASRSYLQVPRGSVWVVARVFQKSFSIRRKDNRPLVRQWTHNHSYLWDTGTYSRVDVLRITPQVP